VRACAIGPVSVVLGKGVDASPRLLAEEPPSMLVFATRQKIPGLPGLLLGFETVSALYHDLPRVSCV
jgi:hypothetical protein